MGVGMGVGVGVGVGWWSSIRLPDGSARND
jgi:hypothetical protein